MNDRRSAMAYCRERTGALATVILDLYGMALPDDVVIQAHHSWMTTPPGSLPLAGVPR